VRLKLKLILTETYRQVKKWASSKMVLQAFMWVLFPFNPSTPPNLTPPPIFPLLRGCVVIGETVKNVMKIPSMLPS
jgi:hypothetical protein